MRSLSKRTKPIALHSAQIVLAIVFFILNACLSQLVFDKVVLFSMGLVCLM
jgi:hypothetical protein